MTLRMRIYPTGFPRAPYLAYARTGPSHMSLKTSVDHATCDGKTTLCGLKEIGGSDENALFDGASGFSCRRCIKVLEREGVL
jgi:hypothetical protein